MDFNSEFSFPVSDFTPLADGEELVVESVNRSITTPLATTNLKSIDFDPFIDGEILIAAPATESQKEIWLGSRMSEEANLACVLSQTLTFKGLLNVNVLQSAIQQIVFRHESLRATFSGDGNTILIAKPTEFISPLIDLSQLSEIEQLTELANCQQQVVRTPFDLQHGPLFKCKIVKINTQHHVVVLTVHHTVCDGWSLGIIVSELAIIYSALNQGQKPELALPESFSTYAFAKQNKVNTLESAQTIEYWQSKFINPPPLIDLPADFPRPAFRTFDAAREYHTLSSTLVNKIKQLGIKHGSSLMTTLLVSFEVFLYRLTGQLEFTVGIPTAGQTDTGQYNLLGHCVNFLPIRSRIQPDINFGEYLKARNSSILDDYEHQDFTFGSLLKKLSVPRDPSRIPLISAVFNLDLNGSQAETNFDQLLLETRVNPSSFATFEFFLNGAIDASGQIQLDCQYNTNLFSAATIRRRLQEFEALLTSIGNQAEQQLCQISLLSSTAAQELLVSWNDTSTKYPHQQTIHQLFEEVVELNGEKVALVLEQQQLTYRELNTRANYVANYLVELGVRTDQLVGIYVDRSLETIIGILGILKAGGAYLPLDLASPPDRLSYMLKNAQVSVLLTKKALVEKLPADHCRIICLDHEWPQIAATSPDNLQQSGSSDDLAYVMYTSGSTGQPKGVCIPHRGVVRLVKSNNYIDFGADQVFLQLAPISFDAATFEIWGSLLNGAKLVLFPEDKPSLSKLGQVIQQQHITTLWLTAGLFHLMVDERLADLQSIRQLIAGGDALSVSHVQKLLAKLKNCRLVNGYGPTENTTFTCCHHITDQDQLANSVPIGKPIANTQVYILDSHLNPVPIGVPGELHTGGDGLARGYLNLPDLTNAKFITNPFVKSQKLYKTGDLARYLPDGSIEFLGRIDNQVKIRGFRLELGEIEAVLSQYPNLREVKVIDREDRAGDKRLVAYVVCYSSAPPSSSELRDFMKSHLPEYMIPSAFVVLDTLPLTINGKVDRHALPEPNYLKHDAAASNIAPSDELERMLVKIWEAALGIQPISIRDNFFEIGGHSLIAVKIFAAIEQIWGYNLPLTTLFQKQTIEDLATVLRQDKSSTPWSSLVLIQAGHSKPPLFCIHPIGGNILEYYALTNYLSDDQPIYGLQSQGLDGQKLPLWRVEDMASHYIQEMQSVQPDGPYYLTGYSFGGLVAFEIAQQLYAQGQKIALLALLDTSAPNLPSIRPSLIQSIGIHVNNLWQLKSKERNSYIVDRIAYRFKSENNQDFLARNLYKPEELTPQLLAILEANLEAGQKYTANVYPGDVTLLRCEIQDLEHYLHPELGWRKLVAGDLKIYPISGAHFGMLKEPRIQSLAEKLRFCLDQSQSKK